MLLMPDTGFSLSSIINRSPCPTILMIPYTVWSGFTFYDQPQSGTYLPRPGLPTVFPSTTTFSPRYMTIFKGAPITSRFL